MPQNEKLDKIISLLRIYSRIYQCDNFSEIVKNSIGINFFEMTDKEILMKLENALNSKKSFSIGERKALTK